MRARVTLQIEVAFSEPVRSANTLLRLTPRPFDGLHVLDWFVGVEPVATLRRIEDGYGNMSHSCSHAGPLERIAITAEGQVETQDAAGVSRGLHEKQPLDLFLRHSHDGPGEEITAFAKSVSGADRLSRLHLLMGALHDRIAFAPTDSAPRAAAAVFAEGKGCAREIAQIFVTAARSQNIPARFVSGLLLDGAEGAAFHAWAEAHVDGIGWIAFDGALGFCPRDVHLRLAHGVDYWSAAPWRQAFSGYADQKVETRLKVTAARQASWQTQQ
ncbi:transglutaminase family protein [Rhodoblastus acidophilus]|jgi:transglutaminase-like putative cysteine protease|uniref:Transglutaminase family protein n=1 Tax=Rhodoblastus acidophilus TaxID=1074 RepID=A0A6N8DKB9_RHOAC|nr:transglutaminase family protein [Rhodoblastus acidophilus]MCW2272722.1 transglutaminase-like putative cysteine protease [Rhodoblastus acidophilus]MTV29633.1 transglutaminase family protein [Rhodoblastus acidophilus]